MSEYDYVRLETTGGTVIAYLAPNFQIEPTLKNDLFTQARPNDKSSISRDQRTITTQVVAQGVFEHSENLPADHRNALESLFGTAPVTARDQVNRIRHYMNDVGGPFAFYDGTDSYTAQSDSGVDRENGTFPVVQIDEFRPPSEGGFERFNYMLKMVVGIPR